MQIGYIKAMVYTSDAQIPIENAVFTVYREPEGRVELIGVRTTDAEGKTSVVPVEAPDSSLSQNKGNDTPYARVNVRIDHPDYRTVFIKDVQVFAGQVSIQQAAMRPVDTKIPTGSRAERFDVPKQNL